MKQTEPALIQQVDEAPNIFENESIDTVVECTFCPARFESLDELRNHQAERMIYECSVCESYFHFLNID